MKRFALSSFVPHEFARYQCFHWPESGLALVEDVVKGMPKPENLKVLTLPCEHPGWLHWFDDARWVVIEIEDSDYVANDGFVSFQKGRVISSASPRDTCLFLQKNGLPVPSGLGKMVIAGDWETAVSGQYGISIAGTNSRAESGQYGVSYVNNGTALAGESGMAVSPGGEAFAGNRGVAIAGNFNASAEVRGIAITTDEFQTSKVGERGLAIAGIMVEAGGTAIAGNGGIALTKGGGPNGKAQAGEGGILAMLWHDGWRDRLAVGYVGENGIEPNTLYTLTDEGIFVRVP